MSMTVPVSAHLLPALVTGVTHAQENEAVDLVLLDINQDMSIGCEDHGGCMRHG